MKKRLFKIFISCLVLCVCMAMAAPAAFAEGETTYVVSFRPGEHGTFSESAVSYLSAFGDVEMTSAGNLFVVVPSGSPFPAGILSYLSADEGYYYRDGFAGDYVTEDAAYVAQFGILSGGGARYTVKFVDSASGAELAESYTGYANPGDVIPFTAKTVPGYNVDSNAKSITVSDGASISFLYTSNGSLDEIRYEYGQDTVVTQTVTTVQAPANNNANANNVNANANTANNNAANSPANAANSPANPDNNPVEINENEVPLAGNESEPVQIEDSDTPLAGPGVKADTEREAKNSVITIAVGALVGVLLILAAIALFMKKKKKKDAEE